MHRSPQVTHGICVFGAYGAPFWYPGLRHCVTQPSVFLSQSELEFSKMLARAALFAGDMSEALGLRLLIGQMTHRNLYNGQVFVDHLVLRSFGTILSTSVYYFLFIIYFTSSERFSRGLNPSILNVGSLEHILV